MTARLFRSLTLCLLMGALAVSVQARDDDPIELPPVWTTGNRLWTIEISYDSAIVTPPSLFNPTHQPFRSAMATEDYQEWRSEVALATTDPLNTTDVRCSAVASSNTRQTTSMSDTTERYLAAYQLFTAINASKGLFGIRAAMGGSPPELYNGKYHATFTITYIDGGSEKWVVAPGISPSLLFEANVAPLPSGDGVAKPCPIQMKG